MESAKSYAQESCNAYRLRRLQIEQGPNGAAFSAKNGRYGPAGITVAEEYGGWVALMSPTALVAREVERVDSGYRSMSLSVVAWF